MNGNPATAEGIKIPAKTLVKMRIANKAAKEAIDRGESKEASVLLDQIS